VICAAKGLEKSTTAGRIKQQGENYISNPNKPITLSGKKGSTFSWINPYLVASQVKL
jgi:hypothetical protein